MKFIAGPTTVIATAAPDEAPVLLYGLTSVAGRGSIGGALHERIVRRKLEVPQPAWEFLSVALAVLFADGAVLRNSSPDGWTREISVRVAVEDPGSWARLSGPIESALRFLTTDIWTISFVAGGEVAPRPEAAQRSTADAVVLLSGGLDSLIGAIDLQSAGISLLPVSKLVRGDAKKQEAFALLLPDADELLQLNDNASTPEGASEPSQRARSLVFLAFAVLAATSTASYAAGATVDLNLCENGFIAINPPLTGARVGSLSTRTAHPEFLGRVQEILDALGLRVRIVNPYAAVTKGEMLRNCADQGLLVAHAAESTSCGRFQRYGYVHCGRCVPCQIRRASFLAWGVTDTTTYHFANLSKKDSHHAYSDDVISVGMALSEVRDEGFDNWVGTSLSSKYARADPTLRPMVKRGLAELEALHQHLGLW